MKNPFSRVNHFIKETIGELKKASWPSQKELRSSTIVVLIAILVIGFYISVVDFSIYQVVRLLMGMVRA